MQLTHTTGHCVAIVAGPGVACALMSLFSRVAGSISTDCLINLTYV